MGKGSKRRPLQIPQDTFDANWDKAFPKKVRCPNCGVENRCHATAIIPVGYEVACDECAYIFVLQTHT